MTAVGALMRATRKRRFTDPAGGAAMLARPKGDPSPPRAVTRALTVSSREVGGFPVVSLAPPGTPVGTGPVVVHLHGGAYVNEVVRQHWELAQAYAEGLGCEVLVPLYGLAPDHHAEHALAMVTALLELALAGRPAYVSGDSAGGGLALLAAQHASPAARGTLRGLGLLAPWVDLTMANPEIEAVERRDPWLARAALHEVARVWAAPWDVADPRVSPLHGDLAGLPPVDLWVGDRDVCLPDSRLLRDRLLAAGVEVDYVEQPGALHVYPILPVPEGRAARRDLVGRAGERLGLPAPA